MRCSPFSFSLKQAACMHWLPRENQFTTASPEIRVSQFVIHAYFCIVVLWTFLYFLLIQTFRNVISLDFLLFIYSFIYLTLPIIYIYIQELHTMDKWQGTRYSLRQLQRPLMAIHSKTSKTALNITRQITRLVT